MLYFCFGADLRKKRVQKLIKRNIWFLTGRIRAPYPPIEDFSDVDISQKVHLIKNSAKVGIFMKIFFSKRILKEARKG